MKGKCGSVCRTGADLMRQKMPTEQHQRAWDSVFVRVLELRCLAGQASVSWAAVTTMVFSSTHYHVSKKYLDEGGPKHVDKALAAFPFASVTLQILLICRVLLFLLSLKWRRLSRLALFLEITIYVAESFLPVDVGWMDFHASSRLIAVIIQFQLSYFYFLPSLLYAMVGIGVWYYNRMAFYEDESLTAIHVVSVALWFVANIVLMHIVLTWVGQLFAESEVLKEGNVNILDNLEEGVIILKDDEKREILYSNTSASGSMWSQQ